MPLPHPLSYLREKKFKSRARLSALHVPMGTVHLFHSLRTDRPGPAGRWVGGLAQGCMLLPSWAFLPLASGYRGYHGFPVALLYNDRICKCY